MASEASEAQKRGPRVDLEAFTAVVSGLARSKKGCRRAENALPLARSAKKSCRELPLGSLGAMVFTGIVEEMGTVASVERKAGLEMWDGSRSEGFVLRIQCLKALEGAYIGCSIAVNGTCLTATQFDKEAFEVNCAPETLRRTDLGDLKPGAASKEMLKHISMRIKEISS